MPALAYVNGRYGPIHEAGISVEDRGFQFADSLYEVVAFLNGRFLDWGKHLWRLRRGLAALFIEDLPTDAALAAIARRLVRQSRFADGLLYIQISRGAARRDHGFPPHTPPTLAMTVRRFDFRQRLPQLEKGVAAISLPDQRWERCDLKTTGLLPAVLAKQEARRANAFEAVFVKDGQVTEGGSTNIHMVDAGARIVTHPLSARILPGIARDTALALARESGLEVVERPFSLEEARAAPELFLTSTTAPLLPIVSLDGAPVGNGAPGPVCGRLGRTIWTEVARQTGWRA
ncbi:aminotransferase class IV [Sandaracinobacter sp. RS1-74]|uniref:aminotransferase class IV n=1 Tax=Sandaracinobacteroides sayramensis TaxID=2913411 RepID=UPI001EDA3438|nr:aminotransferase class IV [Sandaracinobacteroides sayramensis]MCG2840228.1 aminotransferase class IV [Sandaracinobacteroides sayramensis]